MKKTLVPWLALLAAVAVGAAWSAELPVETKGEEVTVLRGDDVPYAYRASVLFHQIASAQKRQAKEGPDVESLLLTMGLDPATKAGSQLVKLALDLDRKHPYVVPDQELAQFDKDYDAINAHLERRELERLAAVGEGLGRWLLEREASNLAVDPLLDRLLNGPHMSVSMFSTEDTEAELRFSLQEMVERFERGMIRGFGSVPSRLEQTP